MENRLRIETPEHAATVRAQLVDLEQRFRALLGNPAASRNLAAEIMRRRTALTSYSLRHQVRHAHDQRVPDSA